MELRRGHAGIGRALNPMASGCPYRQRRGHTGTHTEGTMCRQRQMGVTQLQTKGRRGVLATAGRWERQGRVLSESGHGLRSGRGPANTLILYV